MTVLWMVAGGAALGLVLAGIAREAVGASTNRIALRRAAWQAEGCLQAAMSTLGAALAADGGQAHATWLSVDSALREPGALPPECAVQAEPLGARLSLASATREQLASLFRLSGMAAGRADSLAAAIDDWRDTDRVTLPGGAEREWYAEQGRPGPRNALFAAVAELQLVRDCCDSLVPLHLLTTERGRVYVARAPDTVLAAGTNLSLATVARAHERAIDVLHSADLVAASVAEGRARARIVTTESLTDSPDGWLLIDRETRGDPPVTVTVEYLVARSGPRVALLRRRSWP